MSTGSYFVYIIAIASLVANATATGSVVLLDKGQGVIISDSPATLVAETVFFLALALLILVKLIDKIIRRRYDRENGVNRVVKPTETSKDGRKMSTEQDEHKPTGQ